MSRMGNESKEVLALLPIASLNGGSGAETEINGPFVDTYRAPIDVNNTGYSGLTEAGKRFRRVRVSIGARCVNTSNRRFKVLANLQDATSSTGGGVADFGATQANALVWLGSGTQTRTYSWEQDLTSARRFVRVQFTPRPITASGANTTASGAVISYAGVMSFRDPNRLPASTGDG